MFIVEDLNLNSVGFTSILKEKKSYCLSAPNAQTPPTRAHTARHVLISLDTCSYLPTRAHTAKRPDTHDTCSHRPRLRHARHVLTPPNDLTRPTRAYTAKRLDTPDTCSHCSGKTKGIAVRNRRATRLLTVC